MSFEQLRSVVATLEREIENGPIVPKVTPEEIRNHLSRYDFAKPVPLEEVVADVEQMMRQWQVQVTHPRYFGLVQPERDLSVDRRGHAGGDVQSATGDLAHLARGERDRTAYTRMAGCQVRPSRRTPRANFTSGGAEANLSAAIVALTRAFPEYGDQGLPESRPRNPPST